MDEQGSWAGLAKAKLSSDSDLGWGTGLTEGDEGALPRLHSAVETGGYWRLETTGDWKLETGNWRLLEDCVLETGNLTVDRPWTVDGGWWTVDRGELNLPSTREKVSDLSGCS